MMRFLGEPLTENEITEILDEADTDNDGVIDYTEFFTMMGTILLQLKLELCWYPYMYPSPTLIRILTPDPEPDAISGEESSDRKSPTLNSHKK
jgi:hypothetical protein